MVWKSRNVCSHSMHLSLVSLSVHFFVCSHLSQLEETRLSSVVCDDRCDSIIVQLDKKGFHPNSVFLQKVSSLLAFFSLT